MLKALMIAATLACVGVAGVVSSTLQFAARAAQSSAARKAEAVIPLEGLDPVLLTQGTEKQGDEKFAVTRGRFRYLFAGAETKAAFEREPERYEIQLGGACARMGPSAQGNPDLFTVHKERIYIFGSPTCVKAFKAAPESFLEPDPAPVLRPVASDESLQRGRALIEKAVEAAGGAAKIDGLASYQEQSVTSRNTPQGVAEIKTALYIVYPDQMRRERAFPFGTIADVVTRGDGFTTMPRETDDMFVEQRAAFGQEFKRRVLAILRARRGEGFKAAAMGANKAGGGAIEQVALWFDGLSLGLGIDPQTGRVQSLSYRGRGPSGAFGDITQTFSDFRAVDGLTLPFKISATFNGEAEPTLSATIESIVINGPVPQALFERPKPATAQQ
jgi:YHS domain-containing protein